MIENSFLESGFGFTTSKVLPYIITILIGLIIVFLLRAKLNFRSKLMRISLKVVISIIPVVVYFTFNPIYEGDFSNNFKVVQRTLENNEVSGDKLYVISIPGCPFCKMAMSKMLQLEERNPGLEIEYLICSRDSSTIDYYAELNEGKIPIKLAENPEELMKLTEGSFPTYILSRKNEELKKWNNQDFGVRALDEVESIVSK